MKKKLFWSRAEISLTDNNRSKRPKTPKSTMTGILDWFNGDWPSLYDLEWLWRDRKTCGHIDQ